MLIQIGPVSPFENCLFMLLQWISALFIIFFNIVSILLQSLQCIILFPYIFLVSQYSHLLFLTHYFPLSLSLLFFLHIFVFWSNKLILKLLFFIFSSMPVSSSSWWCSAILIRYSLLSLLLPFIHSVLGSHLNSILISSCISSALALFFL